MPDDYKDFQGRYDSLEEEYDEEWSDDQKRDHYENMKEANEHIHHGTNRIPKAQNAKVLPAKGGHARELQGRLEAREEWGDDGNDAHDRRIEMLRERDEALDHGIAHAKGEYEYQTEGIQDIDPDLRRELEIENDERWGYNEAVEGDRDERQDGNDEREDEQEENSDMEIESDSD